MSQLSVYNRKCKPISNLSRNSSLWIEIVTAYILLTMVFGSKVYLFDVSTVFLNWNSVNFILKSILLKKVSRWSIIFIVTQQTFFSLQDALKTPSRHVFSVVISCLPRRTIFRLLRRLDDVLKMSWKTRNCHDLKKPFCN